VGAAESSARDEAGQAAKLRDLDVFRRTRSLGAHKFPDGGGNFLGTGHALPRTASQETIHPTLLGPITAAESALESILMTRSLVTLLGIALLASGCESLIPRRDPGSVAAAYAAAGRYDEAAREVAIAVRSHPRNAKLRRLAAEIHTQAGQVPQAIYHLEAAIQISPSDAQAWIQLAELEKERQNVADAYVAYRRAAELAPEDVRAVSGLALSADSLGFDDEARSAYARWAELEQNVDAQPGK